MNSGRLYASTGATQTDGSQRDGIQPGRKDQTRGDAPSGELDIHQFIEGICYDTAAFIKYLLSANTPISRGGITDRQLRLTGAQAWIPLLESELLWTHKSLTPPGSILTFRRLRDNKVFHAAVSAGWTFIRGTNGGRLGSVWRLPADLNRVLKLSPHRPAHHENVFWHDNTDIVVQVQKNLAGVPMK